VTDWAGDERELVRRCREGSDAAYAMLVREHRPRLYTLAYRLTGDRLTAEDVVQEAFLAAFKAIDRFDPNPSLAAWLNTITIRIARRAASRARANAGPSLSAMEDEGAGLPAGLGSGGDGPAGDPVAAAEAAELRSTLTDAIERLPFSQRAAVVLRYMTGLDYAAGAQAMEVPLNTFKSHLLRGTRALREELAHLQYGLRPRVDPTEDAVRMTAVAGRPVPDDATPAPAQGVSAPTRRG
jgi:RNA polymerase sigma-70 factor (ECF subfamily)